MTETGGPLRILHAPRNIANQAGYVAAALRQLGHHVEVWEYGQNPFSFPVDRVVDTSARDPRVAWDAFLEAIEHFDILHFHFGRSLLGQDWSGLPPYWDLPVYRALGKKVFFTFHGTDIRIRRIHLETNPWSHYRSADVPADDDRTEKSIEVYRTYADRMFVTSVNYRHFVPEAVLLPRVIDLAAWPEQAPEQRQRPRIVHAPSRRGTKGTSMILEGLDRLAAEGVAFDLELIENAPHEVVRRLVSGADIVVDNLIAGSYGLTSMEAMACSRVAVANLGHEVSTAYPDCPVVGVDPDTFVERMRTLIADRAMRLDQAARGRAYLARVHDAPVIAAQLVQHYRAPSMPVRRGSMPDWMSHAKERRIEQLEARVARLQQDIARARFREDVLRRRLGEAPAGTDPLPDTGGGPRARLMAVLPAGLRNRLRRARSRLRPPR